MDSSDEALMEACQRGDERALEALIRRHGSALLGYLVRMTKDREEAEDLFQETFVRVHAKAGSYAGRGRFKSWLFAIATRVALDSLRRKRRHPAVSLDAEPSAVLLQQAPAPDPLPWESAAQSDEAAAVRRAVAALPPRQRATLALAYFEGQSYPEVARTLGCSVGTVKTQMSRALRSLAARLPDPAAVPARGGGA
jgi:RNA polymerase sigma-70 factor (ECF subfamily)